MNCSADNILKDFFIFLRKQDINFHANCLKNKKNGINLSSAEFAQIVVKVNVILQS